MAHFPARQQVIFDRLFGALLLNVGDRLLEERLMIWTAMTTHFSLEGTVDAICGCGVVLSVFVQLHKHVVISLSRRWPGWLSGFESPLRF
jgi:hypothetical protein